MAADRGRGLRGRIPPGMEPGLQETVFFDPRREAWGFGAHVAMVRIDRETGKPTIEKLVLVDDCGVIINPMIVEGQVHGGVAQGLGEALREQMLFGDEGQVLTGTLMNYAVMRAGRYAATHSGRDRNAESLQSVGSQRRRRSRYQRRAAGSGQCHDGCLGSAGHRSYRHALYGAQALGSDTASGREIGNEIVKLNRFPRSPLHRRSLKIPKAIGGVHP